MTARRDPLAAPYAPARLATTAAAAAADSALGHAWVQATPFRAHVHFVMAAAQTSWRAVAWFADVPANTVRTLLYGRGGVLRPRIDAASARRLIAVDAEKLKRLSVVQVPARETATCINDLRREGTSWSTIADYLAIDPFTCRNLADGETTWCSAITEALAVAARTELIDDDALGVDPLAA